VRRERGTSSRRRRGTVATADRTSRLSLSAEQPFEEPARAVFLGHDDRTVHVVDDVEDERPRDEPAEQPSSVAPMTSRVASSLARSMARSTSPDSTRKVASSRSLFGGPLGEELLARGLVVVDVQERDPGAVLAL